MCDILLVLVSLLANDSSEGPHPVQNIDKEKQTYQKINSLTSLSSLSAENQLQISTETLFQL